MTMIGNDYIPVDAMNRILSNLDVKSLGRIQRVSKNLYKLAGNDEFWKNLFKRTFGVDLPSGAVGKGMLKNGIIIKNEKALIDMIVTFLCHVKWDKKTRLECVFPTAPSNAHSLLEKSFEKEIMTRSETPTMIIEQSFGHQRGKRTSMNSLADETKYACFVGDVKWPYAHSKIDHEANGIIPYFTQICSPISLCSWHGAVLSSYFEANVEGVDVGYGNTLGYFSSINQWKEPFELFYIQENNGSHKWAGLIPNSEFKFVKIDPSGKITWENTPHNRYWGPRSSGRPHSWEGYLKHIPVSFA